jgi:hypothetical protein
MSATDMPFERLEALLRGDEPRTLEEKARASLLSELRAGALAAPDTLRESVLAAAPRMGRKRVRVPSRRLVLVVVPVAAALAVGAALIHGFVSGGSRPFAARTHAVAALGAFRQSPGVAGSPEKGVDRAAVYSGANTPSAKSGGNQQLSQSFHSTGAVPVASGSADSLAGKELAPQGAVSIPTGRLVHADASVEVRVGSHAALTRATNKATQIVSKLNGYPQSVQYQTTRSGSGNAYLALRVPVGNAQTAITQLGALGMLVSEEIQTQDLQHQFNQQTNRIGSLQRAIAIYEQALNSGSVSGSQRIEVQIKLSDAEHTLATVRKARSGTAASGATADISLTLTTNKNAIVPGGRHHNGGSAFGRRLGDAAHFLGLEGVYVLYTLVLLSPFILLGGLGWALVRERRRRDERRLLASA